MNPAVTTYNPPVPLRPRWSSIPGITPRALLHARQSLPAIRSALAQSKSDFLCFGISTAAGRRRYSCTSWHRHDGGFRLSNAGGLTQGLLEEVCGALADLARDLSARWPENARPRSIGLASDGHCIIFSADHPTCEGSAWLHGHLTGKAPAAVIVDDGGDGALSRICPRS